MPASLNVVPLYESNHRDPAATLRRIADEIEAGQYGDVRSAAVVLLGGTMEVFGMGSDAEGPSIGMLLHSGFMRISKAIEEHGQTA